MDYYYSSNPGMSSRGRFPSRGNSYRGGGRGDSSYRGSRGGYSSRGSYTSPRGRGGYYPKYETSSSKYPSETSKYSSHGRMEDSYRKPESSSYGSGREHSHHRSDMDVGRKRMRSDSYSQQQGTSSRRSHEVDDYRSGGSRYSNTNSYTESRGYSDSRGEFKKPRVSEYKPKEDYRGRKEMSRSSGQVSKTRSFRGRTVRGRGIVRRGGESFLARKRASLSGSRRSASELLSLRRAKILKLKRQRWRERAKFEMVGLSPAEKKSKDGKDDDDEEEEEEEEDDDDDDDDHHHHREGRDEKMDVDEKKEDKQNEEKEKGKEDGEIDDKADEKDRERDRDKEKEKEKSKKNEERIDFFGKPFMKLQCPQCSTKCITFKEYMQHLYRPTHLKAMHERSEQLKVRLAKMRIAQRAKQKKADEEDVTNMNTRPIFCPICKLNYSHGKAAHQASEAHKKMRNFLQPYCKICRISLKSPMMYERHICHLDHLRRKDALDEKLAKSKGSGVDYNMDSFMVLDSVGSGDEGEEVKDAREDDGKKDKDPKSEDDNMHLGQEFIHKVEVLYCEVCRTYLPRSIDEERAVKVHCWTKTHFRCYLRFGNDRLLERIQGKEGKKTAKEDEHCEDEKGDADGKDLSNDTTKDLENHEESVDDEAGIDDKLWADVTDLLNQVEPEPKSDDEDDEGGRFDRFKSNEKKENGEAPSPEEGEKETERAPPPKEDDGSVAEKASETV